MGKILKHDFKNSYKEFLIMCAAIIIMSILLGITCLFDLNSFLGRVFFMSSMTFYILIITAVGILWIVYIINSINKKFFTREGYLTFTTPISIDKLIISKILVNFIWFIVVMVTFFISVLIIVFFATRGYVDVFSGQAALAANFAKCLLKPLGQSFKGHLTPPLVKAAASRSLSHAVPSRPPRLPARSGFPQVPASCFDSVPADRAAFHTPRADVLRDEPRRKPPAGRCLPVRRSPKGRNPRCNTGRAASVVSQ